MIHNKQRLITQVKNTTQLYESIKKKGALTEKRAGHLSTRFTEEQTPVTSKHMKKSFRITETETIMSHTTCQIGKNVAGLTRTMPEGARSGFSHGGVL